MSAMTVPASAQEALGMLECAAGFLAGLMVADRPGTWFVVYRALPGSAA